MKKDGPILLGLHVVGFQLLESAFGKILKLEIFMLDNLI